MRQKKGQKRQKKRTESQQSKMTASALFINEMQKSQFPTIEVCELSYQEVSQ